ncbi:MULTISPECIES: hypothetical protein [Sphingomonas]|nr:MULTISPECIES: hypothetical protein [Sphingomonas]
MTPEQIAERIAKVEAMIAAREGKAGYAANVAACRAELEQLRAL